MSSDSLNRDRIPALTALVEKWNSLTRTVSVHHPQAPSEIEAMIRELKAQGRQLLGYEPMAVVHQLDDRWLVDLARRGTASARSDLRCLAQVADQALARTAPQIALEVRIEGQRFPEFVQDRVFSRSRFASENPPDEIRRVVFELETRILDHFETEPFITAYAKPLGRFDIYISLDATTENNALEIELCAAHREVRKSLAGYELHFYLDGNPIRRDLDRTVRDEALPELARENFGPSLRRT